MARHIVDFTRSAQADHGTTALPDGATEYQLRVDGQQRPDLTELRWSPRLRELLDALREHTGDDVGEAAARIGRVLADFIATPGWAVAARSIEAEVERELTTVTVRSNASELYLLPWELVALGAVTHAAFLPRLLFRYEWPDAPGAAPRPELSLTRRGRVVFAWSAAGGRVDASRHVKLIERALDAGATAFDDDRDRCFDVVANASCESIRVALERARSRGEPVAVLHLLCHGGLRDDGTFGLCLDDSDAPGERDLVSASRMQQVLVPYAGTVRLVVVAACDGGNAGELGHELGSVAQALHRAGMAAVVASRFPLSWEGARVFATELYERMLRDLTTQEEAFLAARARLSRRATSDWASLQLYARAADGDATRVFNARPYRGLAAFGPEHARFFFGRDAEVDELVRDLDALVAKGRPRFLVVAGASGTGKSSMVMAGAIPRWARDTTEGALGHVIVRPGADTAACLRRVEAKREVAEACARFVVVVDQFEEVFTHVNDEAARTAFARALWDLASEPDGSHCVVVTLRIDFMARCGEVVLDDSGLRLDRVACDPAHQVLVAQMTPRQLLEAIERPAAAVGLAMEPNLAELIVRDVEAEPGALPLMSHALYLLWLGHTGRTLTREAYLRLGSVQGALNTHADAQVEALADDAAREVARRLLVRLVRPGNGGTADTRRRRVIETLRPAQEADAQRFDAVLERLVGARLLVTSDGDGGSTVEIAHEALIRGWARLRGWVDAERVKLAQFDQLDVWVQDWQRTPDALLTGARLGYAEELAHQHDAEFSPDARRLVAESVAARTRAQEAAARALRARRAITVAVIVVLAGATIFATVQWDAARENARNASAASLRAARETLTVQRLAEVSRASELRTRMESGSAPEREVLADALVLWDEARGAARQRNLLRARHRDVGAGVADESAPLRAMRPFTPDVGGALTQATLAATQRMELRGHGGAVTALRWSSDGTRLLTLSQDRTARIWHASTGDSLTTIADEQRNVWLVAWSPEDAQVVVGLGGDVVRWHAQRATRLNLFTTTQREQLNTYALVVSGDGRRAVVTTDEAREDRGLWLHLQQNVRVIATDTGAVAATLVARRFRVDSLPVASRDGATVLMRCDDGRVRVWRTEGDVVVTLEGSTPGRIERIALARDGAHAVTATDHALTLWDTLRGRVVRELPIGALVPCVAFSPDGASVVVGLTGGSSGMAFGIWGVRDGAWNALGHDDAEARTLHFSEDGARLATAHADGTAAVWSLPSGERLLRVSAGGKAVTDAAMSPDGSRLATACNDRTATVWTIRPTGALTARLDAGGPVSSAAFSADGAHLAATIDEAPPRLWHVRDISRPTTLASDTAASAVQFTPDSTRLLTFHEDGVGVWRVGDHARVARRSADHGAATLWSVSADARVASRLDDRRAAVWPLLSDAPPIEVPVELASVAGLWLSPDGVVVALSVRDHVGTWSAVDGHPLATLAQVPASPRAVVFSPDSAQVLTGGADGIVRVSDARSGRLLRELRGHAEAVTACAFSSNGAALATASTDGAIRLWDGRTGAPRATLHGHDGEVRALTFSPDGAHVVTVGADDSARVWSADDGHLVMLLRWGNATTREVHVAPDGRHAVALYVGGDAWFSDLDPVAASATGCALLRDGPIWRDRPRLRDACAGLVYDAAPSAL